MTREKHPIFDRNWSTLTSLHSYLSTTREKPQYFDGAVIITKKGRYGLSPEGLSFTPGSFDPPTLDHLKENRPEPVTSNNKTSIVAGTGATKRTVRKGRKPGRRKTR